MKSLQRTSSCRRLRAARERSAAATRNATPCNQEATEPRRRIDRADRQHQERRLKGVLDLVPIVEHGAADAQHHRAVPSQERGEGQLGGLVVLAPARAETIQQLTVAQGRPASRSGTGPTGTSVSPGRVRCSRFNCPETAPRSPVHRGSVARDVWRSGFFCKVRLTLPFARAGCGITHSIRHETGE